MQTFGYIIAGLILLVTFINCFIEVKQSKEQIDEVKIEEIGVDNYDDL